VPDEFALKRRRARTNKRFNSGRSDLRYAIVACVEVQMSCASQSIPVERRCSTCSFVLREELFVRKRPAKFEFLQRSQERQSCNRTAFREVKRAVQVQRRSAARAQLLVMIASGELSGEVCIFVASNHY